MGFSTLAAEFISEIKRHYPLLSISEVGGILSEVYKSMEIPEEVSSRAKRTLEIHERYDQSLKGRDAIDEDDALCLAADLAYSHMEINTLILDGFYEMTPAEERLVESLIRKSVATVATIPVSHENDDLRYCYSNFLKTRFGVEPKVLPGHEDVRALTFHPAASKEEEVESIARHIKADYLTGRARDLDDILVVFPKLSQYRPMVERVFSRYGVPPRFSGPRDLSTSGPFLDVLSLVESVLEGYPRLKFSRVLSSPHFRMIPEALRKSVPSICLDASLVNGRDSWARALNKTGLRKESRAVLKAFEPLDVLKGTNRLGAFSMALSDVLDSLGFSPGEGTDMDKLHMERVLGLISMLGDVKADLKSFADALRCAMKDTGQERDLPGVLVADLKDVRGIEPEMLYMGGLKDGDVPSRPDMDFILPERVRKALGLVDMGRHLRLQEHIFTRITGASDRVYLSYPTMEGDKFYLPSVFLSGAEEINDRLFGLFSPEEVMLNASRVPLSSRMEEIVNLKKTSPAGSLSVTEVDSFRACARKFFIERVLGLEPPMMEDYEIEPLALGTIVHKVMERLIQRRPKDLVQFEENAASVMDEVLLESPLDWLLKDLVRGSFMGVVPGIYELEEKLRSEGYSPFRFEYAVEAEPLDGIKLKGKVDRIDNSPDGSVEIVDYKTGSYDLSGPKVMKKGASLQLFLYASMLRALGMKPERVGIYSLRDQKIKWVPGRNDLKEGHTLDDFMEASLGYLRETADRLRAGDFRALPLEVHICRNCHERPFCPYIQGASSTTGPGKTSNQ